MLPGRAPRHDARGAEVSLRRRDFPPCGPRGMAIAALRGMAARPNILIVDDEEDSRAALQTVLGTWGYATDAAADGHEALQKAAALHPSPVITDLMMPDMDGLSLLAALQPETPRVPVILLTATGTAA